MLNPKTGKKWKVFMAIPTVGTVADFQPFALRAMEAEYKDEVEFIYPDKFIRRIFHDSARNGLVEEFLKTDCDIMWFLDSDVIPPLHAMDTVTRYGSEWQAAGCPYPVFMTPPGEDQHKIVFTVYKGNKDGGLSPCSIPMEGTDWVDGIATGCLFLKREVFEGIEKPYFEFTYDPISRDLIVGEDISFCHKLLKKGVKFFVDYSTACKHMKNNIDLLEMNNYCMTLQHQAVEAYDKSVRNQVQELATRYQAAIKENKELKEKLSLRNMLKL